MSSTGKNPTFGSLAKHFAGSVYSVPHGKVMYTMWGSYLVWLALRRKRRKKTADDDGNVSPEAKKLLKAKAKRDRKAFSELVKILQSKLYSKHGAYFGAYLFSLVTRVFVTVKLADVGGKNAGDFGSRNWDAMFQGQAEFALWCGVGAICGAAMKYLEKRVALSVREILYSELSKKYFDKDRIPYYRATGLEDPQARMTADLDAYSRQATHLLGYFLKPAIDVTYLAYVMSKRVGGRSLAIFMMYFWFSAKSLDRVKNSLPKSLKGCAIETQHLEGSLREKHQKIHDFREQIAMQSGTDIENTTVQRQFKTLTNHIEHTNRLYVVLDMLNSYVLKYGGAMVGFSVLIPREYLADASTRSVAAVTQGFISDSTLLGSLANAMKDLADSFIEVPRVAGLASRVYEMFDVMNAVPNTPKAIQMSKTDSVDVVNITVRAPIRGSESPKMLVENLTFKIEDGQHTIVTGPNGAGKSSLFRVLSGLWHPQSSESVSMPHKSFFMPQDTYFPLGPLSNQVTYPLEPKANDRNNIKDLLNKVGLAELYERPMGLGAVEDWGMTLSGGQKQRLAWARMFFHAPKFGFIDEGTSAVSIEVIETLYSTAKELGITLVSIAHQESLEAYHNASLQIVGGGDFKWNPSNVE